jgi:enoyl-CoA hydratase/carnithine racemase
MAPACGRRVDVSARVPQAGPHPIDWRLEMSETVLVDVDAGIAVVTLNKPEKLNAWDGPMRARLMQVFAELNADELVRAIILTGAGDRAFSAGQDLAETMLLQSGEDGKAWFLSWRAFYESIRGLIKPCIAALNGVAAGSAFQVALLTDVRVAHPGVRMGQPEINSGIPSVLGPMLMSQRIGLSRTVELTLSGRMMDAEECRQIGLIHHVVPADELMVKAREVAAELAAKPVLAMRLNKQRFRQVTQPAFDEAFESGQAIEAEAYESHEPQAEMEKFFADRQA